MATVLPIATFYFAISLLRIVATVHIIHAMIVIPIADNTILQVAKRVIILGTGDVDDESVLD
jgi:hypothetical protein